MKKIQILLNMVAIFVIAALSILTTQAETYTWDGGGTNSNWSTGENWNPDGSVPVSASDTIVQLDGNVRTSQIQDIADPFILNRLEFLNNGTTHPPLNLSGGQITVVTNGATQPRFYLSRANTCVMSNPIEIPADTTLNMEIGTYALTLTGIISGEGAIDKHTQGGGINLNNGANSFSGGLTIRALDGNWRKVIINASGAMGTGPVSLYGGTLNTSSGSPGGLIFGNTTVHTNPISLFQDSPIFVGMANSTTTAVTLNGDLSLNTYNLHLRGGGSGMINGVISGSGANAITKSDPGIWTLSGTNSFTGRVTVGDGTLKLGAAEAINPAVPLTVTGGLLDLNGHTVTNSGVTLNGGVISNGTLYATAASSLIGGTLLAPLTGPAGLTKSGTNTLVMSMANTYEGATTVSDGTLQFAKRIALYNGDTTQWTDTNLIINSGATLALNVGGTGEFTSDDLDILNPLGTATGGFQSGSVWGLDTSFATDGVFTYDTTIGNPGGNTRTLAKLGTGTLALTGLNSYTGPTRLENGILSVSTLADGGSASGIGMSSSHRDNLIFAGGTLRYTGPTAGTDRGFRYAVNTNEYAFDVSQPDAILTFGTIKNSLFDGNKTTITKTGPGTLRFGKGGGSVYNFPVKSIYIMEGSFMTVSGDHIQHNLHSTASQGPALVLGDGAVMGFSNPMENYVDGGEMMAQYVGTQSCARITASSWLLCGPSSTNSAGVLKYNTHIFDINDGADEIDLEISSQLGIYPSIANSHVRKTGAGTLRLKSNNSRFRGTTIIRNGRLLVASNVPKGGDSVLGNCTNDVVIGDADTQADETAAFAFEGAEDSNFTFDRGIVSYATDGVSSIGSISNNNVNFSGAISISNTLQLASMSTGAKAVTINGEISGPGGLSKTDSGVAVLTAANSYAGTTTIEEGTLRLDAAERISDASALRMTGGTLESSGFSQTLASLDIDGDAVIDFGSGSCILTFDASDSETWAGTLTLLNWNGSATGGGTDQFFVGTTSDGLTEAQLTKIGNATMNTARQLATGEVVLLPFGTVIIVR